jgi:NAD(P)-dependent dehydrogenase (short-subunit alcohol dehydrogenase family)
MPAEPADATPARELVLSRGAVARFAAASGDVNPLHVDPSFARRTPFGECIAHGALVTIAMLGALAAPDQPEIRVLRAWFTGGVLPGVPVRVTAAPARDGWELRLTGRGRSLARVLAAPADARITSRLTSLAQSAPAGGPGAAAMRRQPADPEPSTFAAGVTHHGDFATADDLAALAAELGAGGIGRGLLDGLAWASYVVGMELPGLHSLLSGVTLEVDPPGHGARYTVAVRRHDPRTGQLDLDGTLVDAAGSPVVNGSVEAFARSPAAGPDLAALGIAEGAAATPPSRGRAVVIGASRGFGAVLGLALADRGYAVTGVHSQPLAPGEASALMSVRRLDARDPVDMEQLTGEALDGLVLNAALPPIPMGLDARAGLDLAAYVAASLELSAVPLGALLPHLRKDGWVVFCSSSALNAPPRDWPHYVTAKAALEGLAAWTAATRADLRTIVVRPPAMRTEMTNTPTGRIAAEAPETVAVALAERIAGDPPPPGLTVLGPEALAHPAATLTAEPR